MIHEMSISEKSDPIFEKAEFRTRDYWAEEVILANSFVSMVFEAIR